MNFSMIEVLRKELKDGVRDRRSLTGVIGYALFVPVLMGMMFGIVAQQQAEPPGEIVVENLSAAPGLAAYLRSEGYELIEARTELEAGVRSGDVRLALRIDPEFAWQMEQGRPARVDLLVDESQFQAAADRLSDAIGGYGGELARLRLQLRGLAPDLVRPVDLQRQDHSTPAERAAQLLDMLVFFLLMAPFAASMSLAIDMLAGERERRSMELLLAQPIVPWQLAAGKWLSAALFGLMGVGLILAVSGVVMPRVDVSSLGVVLNLPAGQLALLGLVIAPLAFLAAALQLALSLFARSYKEAQFYLSGLLFLPMMLVFGLDYLGVDAGSWQGLVPILAQHELAMAVLRGAPFDAFYLIAAIVSTLLLGAGLIALVGHRLQRERAVLA